MCRNVLLVRRCQAEAAEAHLAVLARRLGLNATVAAVAAAAAGDAEASEVASGANVTATVKRTVKLEALASADVATATGSAATPSNTSSGV